jgi:iron complex outermembrane recepter protein
MSFKNSRGGIALPLALLSLIGLAGTVRLEAQDPSSATTIEETVQVTATRVPEDVESVPASITVVSGEELAERGITNLTGALALVAGVAIPPGGDGGPAGSVPEIWGLREFDAFLLVVDGVPAGGAFNPALISLDLTNVERIEVMRGAAPVMYGTTSFVGVIHVLHRQPGSRKDGTKGEYRLGIGNYSSGLAAVTLDLPALGSYRQSLTVNGEKRGFKDDDTGFDRGHVLYRGRAQTAGGDFRLDFDGSVVNQSPASPHVRQGMVLSAATPLDANYNPSDAKIDEDRFHLVGGYDRALSTGRWSTTFALTHTKKDTIRGFLASVSNASPNAFGFEQDLSLTDIYFDTHWEAKIGTSLQVVAGLDHLYGRGEAESETFAYHANLNGSGAQSSGAVGRLMEFESEDERNFTGLYANFDWNPAPRWHVLIGGRVNRTAQDIEAGEEELSGPGPGEEEEEEGSDSRTTTRGSGMVGVNFLAWSKDNGDGLWLYADARDAYKPAALDFGPEAEADILEPETARSYEFGAKGQLLGGRLEFDISAFHLDFENLIISVVENNQPGLANGGTQRFKGEEIEVRYRLFPDLRATATYARHSSKFVDFVQDFDGVLTQLGGKRLEMAPEKLASYGLVYSPKTGFNAYVIGSYAGDRFLNKRNTALADAYSTWAAGIGFRFGRGELRLDGENLSDERDPIAESELGDAQYYRLPARSYLLSWQSRF